MNANAHASARPNAPAIDWVDEISRLIVLGVCQALADLLRANTERHSEAQAHSHPFPTAQDVPADGAHDNATNAAALLGVSVDASEDEIRAALRHKLTSSRLHPDHGGDAEEAKRFIAAKNLLIEHARRRTP